MFGGAGGGSRTNSASGLQTFGGAPNQTANAGLSNSQLQSQEDDLQEMSPIDKKGMGMRSQGGHQNSSSNLNPNVAAFHGTTASAASQDSGIETIDNPYSRAGKRRMMPRPPTQSGQPNEAHMQSVGSAQQKRPMTGPANRPPLKNASSPIINQDLNSEYMNPIFSGSQGSQLGGDAVQPSNFNFAPPPRTAGIAPAGLGATNVMSDVDFERANTDIEDNEDDQSYYVEEDVTDDEAMEKQRQELKKQKAADQSDGDTDDSDVGFYMPSIMAKSGETPP